jgi:DNA-directed RNA polymerase specialized sigma24 family protein
MVFNQNSPYVDTLVLNALRNNDEAALNYLFTNYYNRLFRTGLKYGSNHEAVEEAIQAVFMDIWQYCQSLGDVVSFEAYLKGAFKKRLSKNTSSSKFDRQNATNTEGVENNVLLSVEAYENILILQETNDQKKTRTHQCFRTTDTSPKRTHRIALF